jgi:hypothetical protein
MRLCIIGIPARCPTHPSGFRLLVIRIAHEREPAWPGSEKEDEVAKIMEKFTVGVSPQRAQVTGGAR